MTKLFTNSKYFLQQIASLLLYESVFDDSVGQAYLNLLHNLYIFSSETKINRPTPIDCLQAYSKWFNTLTTIDDSWQDHLINKILTDDNSFSQQIQTQSLESLTPSLINAVKHDLTILENIYNCSTEKISQWVKKASQYPGEILYWDKTVTSATFLHQNTDWSTKITDLASYYQKHGAGIFAKYRAFRWQNESLMGILNADPIKLSQIIGYDTQKQAIIKNTEFLLAGYFSLHILLYGSRGAGKSSLVKALLSEYGDRGLRLIEVNKSTLNNLPTIIEQLRNVPQKFIIFVDDLSFEEDDDAFKALKVVLEGNITARANNVVVYATSNRRHLIREFFADRPRPQDSDEIHNWDTVQEKLSFSDRFGLTLTFEPANQTAYLNIVNQLAQQEVIDISQEDLEFRAKQWSTRHNGRSGRTARQFIDYLKSELNMLQN